MDTPEAWHQEGEALVAAHPHGSAEFSRGLELLQKAATAGTVEAQLTLGHVYAQVHLLPDAAAQAATWYRRAADQGHPAAQDRLADLYMTGRGVPQSDAEAFRWCRRTAEQAYPIAQCNLAYMLAEGIGGRTDDAESTGWYLRAAAQGDARAYHNLGLRYLEGWGVATNQVQAWAWMANAAKSAYPGSETELASIGSRLSGAELSEARSLAERIAANFAALKSKLERAPDVQASAETYRKAVEDNFAALGVAAFSLDAVRRPPGASASKHVEKEAVYASKAPRIFTVDEFVSRGETAHLMSLASLDLRSAPEGTRDRLSQEHTAFTGTASTLHAALCDPVVRNLERRIARAFALPANHVEPVSVLRYQGGDSYKPHVDYFDAARLARNRGIGDVAGQRIASFLVYLQAPLEGGETHYLKTGLRVAGRDRMALCHFNRLLTGEDDPMTLHTGEPVRRGEKWLARTTLRERPFY